jgi:lipopolysaccharide export system permease protein
LNLLDRHIFKSVLFTCAAAVTLFAFVVALPNVVKDLLTPLLAGQIEAGTFVQLLLLLIPYAISYALPMGILTGVLLTLGRLAADSEITAMRSAGISAFRVARPVFILGLAGLAGAVFINFESMPWARVQYQRQFEAAVRADPLKLIVPRTFIRDFRGYVVYVGDKEGTVLQDVWVWELDEQYRVNRVIRAEAGHLEYDAASNSLIPTLVHAKIEDRDSDRPEDFDQSPRIASVERLEQLHVSLDPFFGRELRRMKEEWLTYTQLREKQAILAAESPATREAAAEQSRAIMRIQLVIQEKFNMSLAVFSFALLGVPLGIKVSRRETSANLGIALLLVLGYYMLTVMVKWLDRHPEYRPDLLLWLPNLFLIALAIWLFRRIERG